MPTTLARMGSVANLNKLVDAAGVMRELHPDMTLNQLVLLCLVAANPGITQRQMMEATGLADSSTSRIISILSKYGNRGTKPLGLIDVNENESDRRTKSYVLTPLGRSVVSRLIDAVGKGGR